MNTRDRMLLATHEMEEKFSKLSNRDRNKFGYPYNFEQRDDWYYYLIYTESKTMLEKFDLKFVLTEYSEPNAAISYSEGLVVLTSGILERILKLSELIVSSGVMNDQPHELHYQDLHFVAKKFFYPPYNKETEPLLLNLFNFISITLIKFILLHEVFHFKNDHGIKCNKSLMLEKQFTISDLSKREVFDSHARELIADYYAFHTLINENLSVPELNKRYSSSKGYPEFILTLITCYFRMMDSLYKTKSLDCSHPPSPHRAIAIYTKYQLLNNTSTIEANIEDSHLIWQICMHTVNQVFSYQESNQENEWLKPAFDSATLNWIERVSERYSSWVKC